MEIMENATERIEMTQETYDSTAAQKDELVKGRSEIVERLSEARAQGDLSENAEYSAAKDELRDTDRKIEMLEATLRAAVIVESSKGSKTVGIGSIVTVRESDTRDVVKYTITSTVDCDPLENRISALSPAGAALMRHTIGDKVTVPCPNGTSYKIKILGLN